MLMPNSLAILGGSYEGEARGRAIGTWAAVGALSGALGPILGGWLVDAVGWRSIFMINIPVALGAIFLSWRYVSERKELRAVPLDSVGAGLAVAALGLLTWAMTEAADRDAVAWSPWLAAVAGVCFLAAFLWQERRRGERAIMPFSMFSTSTFVGLTLLTFFLYGSLGGLLVLLPYRLIAIEHWPAINAGAALLPIPVLIGAGSRTMGRLAAQRGGRLPLAGGAALVGLGLALYARMGPGAVSYWSDVFPPTLLVSLGMGACVAPLTTSVMASVDADRVGVASGFNSAVARIAGLIATALLGFVLVHQSSRTEFIAGFRAAAFVGAGSALIASGCALWLLRSAREPAQS